MNDFREFAKLLEDIASENKLRESAVVLSESQDFIYSHREEFLRQYPDQWIAVYRKDIIGNDKDLLRLIRKLRTGGAPLNRIALEMLSREEIPLAL